MSFFAHTITEPAFHVAVQDAISFIKSEAMARPFGATLIAIEVAIMQVLSQMLIKHCRVILMTGLCVCFSLLALYLIKFEIEILRIVLAVMFGMLMLAANWLASNLSEKGA